MKTFVELGHFAEASSVRSEDFHQEFARCLVEETPGAREVSCNFIVPGSSVTPAHIPDAMPAPDFDYISTVSTTAEWVPDTAATRSAALRRAAPVRLWIERCVSSAARLGHRDGQPNAPLIKQLCLLKRRPGMTRGELRDYYEGVHVPLAEKLLPFMASYARNFVLDLSADTDMPEGLDFDVITEIGFADASDQAKFAAALADPAIGDIFARDEERLFDRSRMSLFLVREVAVQR